MRKYSIPEYNQVVTPSNPAAGFNKMYFKNDDKLYRLDSTGNEIEIGVSSSNSSSYDYVVADDAARNALTGMTIDETIFVIETGIVYKADSATTSVGVISSTDLSKYSEYDYVVADDAARNALTGMTIDETIFVTETGIVWKADSATTSVEVIDIDLSNYGTYDYVVADEAARLALTGMTIDETIFVTETGIVWKADSATTSVEVIDVDLSNYGTYDYVVADEAARLALTGMTVGDTIFKTDTGELYIATGATTSKSKFELGSNKSTNTALGTSDVLFPTQNAVKTYIDNKTGGIIGGNFTEITTTKTVDDYDIVAGDICWLSNANSLLTGLAYWTCLKTTTGSTNQAGAFSATDTITLHGRKITGLYTNDGLNGISIDAGGGLYTDSSKTTKIANIQSGTGMYIATSTAPTGKKYGFHFTWLIPDDSIPDTAYIEVSGNGSSSSGSGGTYISDLINGSSVGIQYGFGFTAAANMVTTDGMMVKGIPYINTYATSLSNDNVYIAKTNILSGASGTFYRQTRYNGYTNLLADIGPIGTLVYPGGPYGNKPVNKSNSSLDLIVGIVISDTEIDYGSRGLRTRFQQGEPENSNSYNDIDTDLVTEKTLIYTTDTSGGVANKGQTINNVVNANIRYRYELFIKGEIVL